MAETPDIGNRGAQFYMDPENTEFVEAGPVTIGVEYRFLYHWGKDGTPTDVVMDQGVCLHVFEGGTKPEDERLRFDCLEIGPHYHYDVQGTDEHVYIDRAADGDPLRWVLERLRTRLPAMLVRSGNIDLARKIDQRELDSAISKVAALADALKEIAITNFQGKVHLVGAKMGAK